MAIIKSKDAAKMTEQERNEKIKELGVELVKSRVKNKAQGKSNPREIRRTIARLLTFNVLKSKQQEVKK
jgi:ribosomal protein L29